MHGVYTLLRAAELAREWGKPLFVAQLDLEKAFDHVRREAAIAALRLQGASLHTIAWISKLWEAHSIEMRMGHVRSKRFETSRGLPQGAPESPVVFTLLAEYVLRGLQQRWEKERGKGYGFGMDDWIFTCLAYADDIILVAESKEALERMIREATEAFRGAGLNIGHAKTNWSSTKATPEATLQAAEASVTWVPSFVFVGVQISLNGCSTPAITHRMAQARKAFSKWGKLLLCPWIAPRLRIRALGKSVWPSLLWGASCWHPTEKMKEKIGSWGARLVATVAGVRRSPTEDTTSWWRKLHRLGWRWTTEESLDLNAARRRQLHQWAGHLARMPHNSQPASALRTRGMQWWRWAQDNESKVNWGVHPKRFKCWRWESQVADIYGEGCAASKGANTGWLATAQDRLAWKKAEKRFAS